MNNVPAIIALRIAMENLADQYVKERKLKYKDIVYVLIRLLNTYYPRSIARAYLSDKH